MRNLIIFLLFLGLTAVSGCQSRPFMDKPSPTPAHMVTKYQSIGPFTAIVVDGTMDVELDGQAFRSPSNRITFISPAESAGTIEARVSDGTLYLRNMEKLQQKNNIRTRVKVPVTETLTAITYSGYGTLTSHNIRTSNFVLDVQGSRYVNLSGSNVGMKALRVRGPGNITVSGIRTNHLDVRSHSNSKMTLSGYANSTDIELSKSSWLNAQGLFTQTSYTNTADNARADVCVEKLLNAFATGYSNIYYHDRRPQQLNQYLRQDGSVLFFPD